MMGMYYVKSGAGLHPVPDDSVERFNDQVAFALLAAGKLEKYDEKRHGGKSGAPAKTHVTK